MLQHERGPRWLFVAVMFLFAVFAAELVFSVRQNSETFDESTHLYAGYTYWKTHDFGVNPEHPPLAKLIAALPILPLRLAVNPPPPIYFRAAALVGGRQFLYSHDATPLLFHSRLAISVFTLALGLLVFFAAREMFGWQAALIALAILVFEPNILANGALVTTDMAVTAMMFGTVYTFYRYLKQRSFARLLVCAAFAGLTLSVKHSGVLVFPILVVLAIMHLMFAARTPYDGSRPLARRVWETVASLVFIGAVAVTMLWACYGFRYAARPGSAPMSPTTAAVLHTLKRPTEARVIGYFERHHLLPEAYLYGMTDVAILTDEGRPTYLWGRLYPVGRWFYFPSVFIIKSTIGFILLLAVALGARRLWRRESLRETLFLLIPAVVYLLFAVSSRLDMGLRHILPVYPFLIVLTGAGAWALMRQSRVWAVALTALLVFHAASSLRAYPAYLAYSNEAWGGPAKTYKVVADSNVGWSSGLNALQRYTSDHHITQCWFAGYGSADLSYFHLPCQTMPAALAMLFETPIVPERVQGPVFIASEHVAGLFTGPPDVNPYKQFKDRSPDAVIDGEILVFNGSYDVRAISAMSHFARSIRAMRTRHPDQALAEAQQAESLAPEFMPVHEVLASLYATAQRRADAEREYQTALHIYHDYGEFASSTSPPEDPFPPQQPALAAVK